jgi:Protein of unknown function (DUF4233)
VKRLLVTVLSMEAVILLLAIVPAKTLGHASAGTAAAVGGGLAVAALLLCGFVGRGKAGLYVGSVFQALVIAAGVLISAMYVLGVIFAALWFTGIWLGRRYDAPMAKTAIVSARRTGDVSRGDTVPPGETPQTPVARTPRLGSARQ